MSLRFIGLLLPPFTPQMQATSRTCADFPKFLPTASKPQRDLRGQEVITLLVPTRPLGQAIL